MSDHAGGRTDPHPVDAGEAACAEHDEVRARGERLREAVAPRLDAVALAVGRLRDELA